MKIAYFDCFSGISGDMVLGALVDAGLCLETLIEELDKLEMPGLTLTQERAVRQDSHRQTLHERIEDLDNVGEEHGLPAGDPKALEPERPSLIRDGAHRRAP